MKRSDFENYYDMGSADLPDGTCSLISKKSATSDVNKKADEQGYIIISGDVNGESPEHVYVLYFSPDANFVQFKVKYSELDAFLAMIDYYC